MKNIQSLCSLLLGCLLLFSCSTNNLSDIVAVLLDDDVSMEDISAEMGLDLHFSDDFMDDLGMDGAVYSGLDVVLEKRELADSEPFLAWGRRITSMDLRTLNISINAGEASVFIERGIDGLLFVDESDDGERNPVEKEFHLISRRYATFSHSDSGTCSGRGKCLRRGRWTLNSISPVELNLDAEAMENEQTVFISKVEVIVDGDSRVSITDPSELLVVGGNFPVFAPGDEVIVEMTVENKGPEDTDVFVYLHRPGGRDRAYDDGTSGGDRFGHDGVYTLTYTIGDNTGKHFAVIDLLNFETLSSGSSVYDSAVWAIPYMVEESGDDSGDFIGDSDSRDIGKLKGEIRKNPFFWHPLNRDITDHGIAFRHGDEGTGMFWGRQVHADGDMRIEIEVDGDIAAVKTDVDMHGKFNMSEQKHGPKKKSVFDEVMSRSAVYHWSSEGNSEGDAKGGWELDSISLVSVHPPDGGGTLSVDRVLITSGGDVIFELLDTGVMQTREENMPVLTKGDEVLLQVTASDTLGDDLFAYLRVGKFHRDRLYDDGTHGDVIAGDGIYSRLYTIDLDRGYYSAVLDLIAAGMLDIESPADYNSTSLGFFFRVME